MLFGFYDGNLFYIIEIMLAELIFLYPCPKRKMFYLRYALVFVALCAVGAFVPRIAAVDKLSSVLGRLYLYIVLFTFDIAGMAICFDLKPTVLLSMCSAGYAVQHMAYKIGMLIGMLPIFDTYAIAFINKRRFFELVGMILVFIGVFFTFGRFSAKSECYKYYDKRFSYLAIATVFICIGISRVPTIFDEHAQISNALYSITCCILALFIQFNLHRVNLLKHENMAIKRVWQEEQKQYEISKSTIERIDIKCHDLKYQIAALDRKLSVEEAESLIRDVNIYDSVVKTGNEVLDVLLAEKGLICREKGIKLAYMGDCSVFSFMQTMEVYSLFGNALDNAIEAVNKLSDKDKRQISMNIERKGDIVIVNISNYFEGDLNFDNGLPTTTKENESSFHGFGLRSMKNITAEYGGDINVSVSGDMFTLNIYLRIGT